MKKVMLKLILIISIFVLSSCTDRVQVKKAEDVREVKNEISQAESFWESFSETAGRDPKLLDSPPQDPDPYPLYLKGLQHENPSVRWYCAYKMLEYSNTNKKDEIMETLKGILNDENESVREAAKFTLSVFKGTFEGPQFLRSPDGRNVAFYRFGELRYNNGEVWLYKGDVNEIWLLKHVDGSINRLTWSPDSKKLCIEYGGRIWGDIAIITDIDDHESCGNGLFSYIEKNKSRLGYKIGSSQRPDPYISLIEWSPDSRKVLLFYYFRDDEHIVQRGALIYDVFSRKVEKIIPYAPFDGDNPPAERPENFSW